MKTAALIRPFLVVALLTATAACTSTPTQESTGEYIEASATTAKVKAAILEEPGLKSLQIGVETFKDEVQLSGFVDTAASKAKAGQVAANVPGVKSVKNNLVVK
ncbi:BON domain-containing protein [Lacibacterium aquatile]|uniref:BON domain-containing protein n=1 Tax=Lacibacterium aquatile TaxID=1168082 RepID=A0ABW5DM15_9PROT